MEYHCPECSRAIPPELVLENEGTFLCPACNEFFTAPVVGEDPSPLTEPKTPPNVKSRIRRIGNALTFQTNACPTEGRFLFLLWLAVWGAAAALMYWRALAETSMIPLAFASAVMAVAMAGLTLLVYLYFGRARLCLGPEGLDFEARLFGLRLSRVHCHLGDLRRLSIESRQGRYASKTHLQWQTNGRSVCFGATMKPSEQHWMADYLQRLHERLCGTPLEAMDISIPTAESTSSA